MRFSRNGGYSWSPELQVMGDKAEELGYKWNRSIYPTPAWSINIDLDAIYTKPLFGIPVVIWDRELRLWSCDCVERVLPIYENWARANARAHLNILRDTINAAREYAHGRIGKKDIEKFNSVSDIVGIAGGYGNAAETLDAFRAMSVAYASYYTISDARIDNPYWATSSYYAAGAVGAEESGAERKWQKEALAHRIDAVAPWRLI